MKFFVTAKDMIFHSFLEVCIENSEIRNTLFPNYQRRKYVGNYISCIAYFKDVLVYIHHTCMLYSHAYFTVQHSVYRYKYMHSDTQTTKKQLPFALLHTAVHRDTTQLNCILNVHSQ